jgi:hypothetical protein
MLGAKKKAEFSLTCRGIFGPLKCNLRLLATYSTFLAGGAFADEVNFFIRATSSSSYPLGSIRCTIWFHAHKGCRGEIEFLLFTVFYLLNAMIYNTLAYLGEKFLLFYYVCVTVCHIKAPYISDQIELRRCSKTKSYSMSLAWIRNGKTTASACCLGWSEERRAWNRFKINRLRAPVSGKFPESLLHTCPPF